MTNVCLSQRAETEEDLASSSLLSYHIVHHFIWVFKFWGRFQNGSKKVVALGMRTTFCLKSHNAMLCISQMRKLLLCCGTAISDDTKWWSLVNVWNLILLLTTEETTECVLYREQWTSEPLCCFKPNWWKSGCLMFPFIVYCSFMSSHCGLSWNPLSGFGRLTLMMGTARHITTRSKAFIMFLRRFTTSSPVSVLL